MTVNVSEVVVLSANPIVTVFVPRLQEALFLSIGNVQLVPKTDIFVAEA
jgi:hypothetical protein